MKVSDIIDTKGARVVFVGPDITLREALATMVENRVGALPVLDPGSDTGSDLILSPGETWIYTASEQAQDLQFGQGTVPGCGDGRPTYENTGMVAVNSFNLTDEDRSHYCNPGDPQIDIRKQAAAAMMKLSDKERSALLLRHYEGHSINEIAEILEMTTGACKQTIFRAVRKMRIALGPLVTVRTP